MDYFVIKGQFHVVGHSPDGDSLKFEATNPKQWDKIITQYREKLEEGLAKNNGIIQLRLQGVDALETHYKAYTPTPPKGLSKKELEDIKETISKPIHHQPNKYADMALACMLGMFGVTKIHLNKSKTSISKIEVQAGKSTQEYRQRNKEGLEGYIIVNDIDKNGRPISWIFAGKTHYRDGSKLSDEKVAKILHLSANCKMLEKGLVYPYFFVTLKAELRRVLVAAVDDAQEKGLNIWSEDKTIRRTGLKLNNLQDLTEKQIIFPYLFRRLLKHRNLRLIQGYEDALAQKKTYKPNIDNLFLDSFFDDTNPYVYLIKETNFHRLDEIIHINKNKITLKTHPGNIVFFG